MNALSADGRALLALLNGVHGSPRENVPQPCLLHERDAHYIQECGGEGA